MALDFESNWRAPTTQPEQLLGKAWDESHSFLARSRGTVPPVQQEAPKYDLESIAKEYVNNEAVRTEIESSSDAFMKAFSGYDSFTESAWQAARIHVLQGKGGYLGGYDIAERQGIPDEAWDKMSREDKNAAYNKDKAQLLAAKYPNPYTEIDRPGYSIAGAAASSMVDLTTLIPLPSLKLAQAGKLGKYALSVGAGSAAINLLDPIGQQIFLDQAVGADDYLAAASFGFVGGTALGFLGAKLSLWHANSQMTKLSDGIESELQRELKKANEIREMLDDPEKLKAMKLPNELADTYRKLYDERIHALSNIDPTKVRQINKLAARVTPESIADDFIVNTFRNTMGLGKLSDDEMIQMYRVIDPDQLRAYIKTSDSYNKLPDAAKTEFDTLFDKFQKASADAVKGNKEKSLQEAYNEFQPKPTKPKDKASKVADDDSDLPFGVEDEFDFIDDVLDPNTPEAKIKATFEAMDPAVKKAYFDDINGQGITRGDDESIEAYIVRGIREGNVARDSRLGAAIGENVGFKSDPVLDEKTGFFTKFDLGFGVEDWVARPVKFFHDYGGKYGKVLAAKLERADRIMREMVGYGTVEYRKAFYSNKLNPAGEDGMIVKRLLNHSLDPSDTRVKDAHIKVAASVKRILDNNLSMAHKYNVISTEEYQKLVTKGAKEGYFPRVWDVEYIRSHNGKKEFIAKLQEVEYTHEQLKEYINAVTGNKHANSSFIEKYTIKKGGKHKLTREGATLLQRKFGNNMSASSGTSTHFEHSLKFPRQMDDILEPFMVPSFEASMTKYLTDTGRRLAHAAEFGAKDEQFSQLLTKIRKDLPERTHMVNSMEEVYKLSVQSPDSIFIKRMMAASEGGKGVMKGLDSYQNLKLGLGQMVNAGQHLINGNTRIAATGGNPITIYKRALQDVFADMRKNSYGQGIWSGGDAAAVADRAGASMELVQMRVVSDIMETPSDRTGRGLSLFNRTASGNLTGISNWWLRATQFERFEHINRVMGYYLGKAHIEDLIAKKKKFMHNPKKVAKINAHLEELGIATNVHPSKIRVREIDEGANAFEQILAAGTKDIDEQARRLTTNLGEGALKFANDINFINSPLTRPLGWNSPYASIFTKFKGFVVNQMAFFKDNVYKPARYRHTYTPAIAYSTIGIPFGLGVNELRQTIRGDDRDLTDWENLMQAFSIMGGLGIASDLVFQASSYREGLTKAIAGPILGDADAMARAMHDAGVYNFTEPQEMELEKVFKAAWKTFGPGKLATDALRIDME